MHLIATVMDIGGSGISSLAFYILAIIITVAALLVVTMRNIFHAGLFLIVTFLGVAGVYILLKANFLAAVQVLIYTGAIAVLILFAIMLTSKTGQKTERPSNPMVFVALVVVVPLFYILILGFNKTFIPTVKFLFAQNTIHNLGKVLLSSYLLPFEIISVLLLVALLGATIIARED